MKSVFIFILAAFAVLACNSCVPAPIPAPPPTPIEVAGAGPGPDGGAGGPAIDPGPEPVTTPGVRLACDNLAALNCPEGTNPSCKRILQHVLNAQLTVAQLDCIVGATSKPEARICGSFISCP